MPLLPAEMGNFCGSLFYHDEEQTLAAHPTTSGRNADSSARPDVRNAAAAAAEERLRTVSMSIEATEAVMGFGSIDMSIKLRKFAHFIPRKTLAVSTKRILIMAA